MVVGCLLCAYFSVNYPAVLESFSTLCTEKADMTAETKMTYLDSRESWFNLYLISRANSVSVTRKCVTITISMSF